MFKNTFICVPGLRLKWSILRPSLVYHQVWNRAVEKERPRFARVPSSKVNSKNGCFFLMSRPFAFAVCVCLHQSGTLLMTDDIPGWLWLWRWRHSTLGQAFPQVLAPLGLSHAQIECRLIEGSKLGTQSEAGGRSSLWYTPITCHIEPYRTCFVLIRCSRLDEVPSWAESGLHRDCIDFAQSPYGLEAATLCHLCPGQAS